VDPERAQCVDFHELVADVHILAASSLWQAVTQGGTSQGSSRGAGSRTGTCNSRFEPLTFHVSAPKPREAWGRTSLEPGVPGWLGMRPLHASLVATGAARPFWLKLIPEVSLTWE